LSLHVINEIVSLLVTIGATALCIGHFFICHGFLVSVCINVFVDSLDDTFILILNLTSEGLVHGEADDLEISLFNEQIKNLEVFLVKSCLSFVAIHPHFGHVFLVCLIYLSQEGGAEEGKETVASEPDHRDQKKHEHLYPCVISEPIRQ